MSSITTHVLDTSRGSPGRGIEVQLARRMDSGWVELARGTTNAEGRLTDLLPDDHGATPGEYRLRFELETYFERLGSESFFPRADVVFRVTDAEQHYHVPLLLSPFGYTTYRGT